MAPACTTAAFNSFSGFHERADRPSVAHAVPFFQFLLRIPQSAERKRLCHGLRLLSIPSPDSTGWGEVLRPAARFVLSIPSPDSTHSSISRSLEAYRHSCFQFLLRIPPRARSRHGGGGRDPFNSFTGFHEHAPAASERVATRGFQFLHRIPPEIAVVYHLGRQTTFQFLHRIPLVFDFEGCLLTEYDFQFLHRIPRGSIPRPHPPALVRFQFLHRIPLVGYRKLPFALLAFNSFTGFHKAKMAVKGGGGTKIFQFLHRIPQAATALSSIPWSDLFQFLHRIPPDSTRSSQVAA